jgi:uncharacterized membrane protein
MEFPEFEDEDVEEPVPMNIRFEVIEYILRKYGGFRARDLASILGCKVKDVSDVLKQLEKEGKIKRAKLGHSCIWAPIEDRSNLSIYY